MLKIIVNFDDPRWKKIRIDYDKVARAALHAAGVGAGRAREISLTLTADSELRRLNKEFRGKDSATNVLSFESGDTQLLGDIFISYDTVMREEPARFPEHAAHLVVHGILHLLGYDHLNDSDAAKMEALEIKALASLGIENPYEENTERGTQNAGWRCMLCAVFCGLMASLGFAPFHFWWATVLGIGGAYYLIAREQSCQRVGAKKKIYALCLMPYALCFGAGYALANFWWVVNSIFVVPELASQFAIWTAPALLGIAAVGALIFSLPFLATRVKNSGARPIAFAASWTALLWLREWLFTGFPWNPVANIALPFPALANSMALWGALGLTFVIVGLTASASECLIKNEELKIKNKIAPCIIFAVLLIAGIVYGGFNIRKSAIRTVSGLTQQSVIIRIVQPAKSAEEKATHNREEALRQAEKNIAVLKELAEREGGARPDLLVFPETSYPYIVAQGAGGEIPMVKELGIPAIIGAMSFEPAASGAGRPKFYNSMLAVGADGKIQKIYSKSHLVPFGEYRPFGDIIPTPGQLSPGSGAETIELAGLSFAPAICYEIIFSDSLVPRGAEPRMIINITNDTWFGKTPGTYQHLDLARRQAIETGLPVVRVNYSGVSAFIAADGKIISQLPVGEAGVLDSSVSAGYETLYRRIGRDWSFVLIMIFSAAAISILGRRRKG